jgi:hypothetical protein
MSEYYGVGEVHTVEQLNILEHFSDGQYSNAHALVNSAEIDSEIAGGPCETCGKEREYRAVYNAETYRAFSVCRTCDDVIEF